MRNSGIVHRLSGEPNVNPPMDTTHVLCLNYLRVIYTLSLLFFLNCLSLEEKLIGVERYPAKRSFQEVTLISGPPETDIIYLGELILLSNEGYSKSYILRFLKKRASKLGADVIWIVAKKKVQSSWLVNQRPGSHYPVKTRKLRTTAKMYRYSE